MISYNILVNKLEVKCQKVFLNMHHQKKVIRGTENRNKIQNRKYKRRKLEKTI